jgi:arginine decarboxylase
MLVTPYPPGIPLMVPGERFNKIIISYLQFSRAFNSAFPGFETDVHGLVREVVDGEIRYFIDVVKEG